MRVLWVCNIMLPAYAEEKGIPHSDREGWLSGAYARIKKHRGADNVTLGVCFPADVNTKEIIDGVSFYTFTENLRTPEHYDASIETRLREIINDFQPDMVHIHGTEFPHALAAVRAFGNPEKTIISIQGVCAEIAKHYLDGLPEEVCNTRTFRDKVRGDALSDQKRKFEQRAQHEEEALKGVKHVAGRTAFDEAAAKRIHPDITYHKVNETLRPCFYKGSWEALEAMPHSIFLSQGDYPLKGFHDVLRAMPKILEEFPDTQLYVAGNSLIGGGDYSGFVPLPFRISGYGKYLKRLIAQNRLGDHVTMLGKLSAEEMKARYLNSNVFVLASSIENSPNALGEAMLLGMPCVATATGGIVSLMDSGREGLLYTPGDVDALAEAVIQIFSEKVIALVYADNAQKRARITHDAKENEAALLQMYHAVMKDG